MCEGIENVFPYYLRAVDLFRRCPRMADAQNLTNGWGVMVKFVLYYRLPVVTNQSSPVATRKEERKFLSHRGGGSGLATAELYGLAGSNRSTLSPPRLRRKYSSPHFIVRYIESDLSFMVMVIFYFENILTATNCDRGQSLCVRSLLVTGLFFYLKICRLFVIDVKQQISSEGSRPSRTKRSRPSL